MIPHKKKKKTNNKTQHQNQPNSAEYLFQLGWAAHFVMVVCCILLYLVCCWHVWLCYGRVIFDSEHSSNCCDGQDTGIVRTLRTQSKYAHQTLSKVIPVGLHRKQNVVLYGKEYQSVTTLCLAHTLHCSLCPLSGMLNTDFPSYLK